MKARLAERLRQAADWLAPVPAAPQKPLTADEVVITREHLLAYQTEIIAIFEHYAAVSRDRGPDTGMSWFPSPTLRAIEWLIGVELETRDRDLAEITQPR